MRQIDRVYSGVYEPLALDTLAAHGSRHWFATANDKGPMGIPRGTSRRVVGVRGGHLCCSALKSTLEADSPATLVTVRDAIVFAGRRSLLALGVALDVLLDAQQRITHLKQRALLADLAELHVAGAESIAGAAAAAARDASGFGLQHRLLEVARVHHAAQSELWAALRVRGPGRLHEDRVDAEAALDAALLEGQVRDLLECDHLLRGLPAAAATSEEAAREDYCFIGETCDITARVSYRGVDIKSAVQLRRAASSRRRHARSFWDE